MTIKLHFSKGLQSSSSLVQHCTALALIKCLMKFDEVSRIFKNVGDALEEEGVGDYYGGIDLDGGRGGMWGKRRLEVEREVRRRVPEIQVVIAFAQQKACVCPVLINMITLTYAVVYRPKQMRTQKKRHFCRNVHKDFCGYIISVFHRWSLRRDSMSGNCSIPFKFLTMHYLMKT